jgi:hypothetical protein
MPAAIPLRSIAAPPPRSPERQRLAVAIDRYERAARAADAVADAQPKTSAARTDAFLGVERAEAALRTAQEEEPRRRTRHLIGEPDDGSPTVPEAERKLAEAKEKYESAKNDEALLDRAAQEARDHLDLIRIGRNSALAAALQASPELARLFVELDAARSRADEIVGALFAIGPRLTQLQLHLRDLQRDPVFDGPTATAWRAALAALESDPDALLPGDDEPPPAPAAAA